MLTDRMLIFGQRRMQTVLAQYQTPPQLPPSPTQTHPVADLANERIKRRPILSGLISEYKRAA